LERSRRQGIPTPSLDARPKLYDDLVLYWEAFNVLQLSRNSMGGGIPLSEIEVYGRMVGIVNTQEFAQTIRLMDRIYLKATEKAAEKEK
jgi:hypothetical protein